MFSRLASALYTAVEALAPPLPLQEEFTWHWTAINKFYTEKQSGGRRHADETGIPSHLRQMSELLEQEEEEAEDAGIGPCMEYLLQHKILDTLCILARADTPPGVRQHVLNFISRLITNSNQTLFPHVAIYGAVKKMVKLCGEVLAAPSERDEIDFLHCVCKKLNNDPQLISCFLEDSSTTPTDITPTQEHVFLFQQGSAAMKSSNKTPTQFPLITSLLTLLQSPDGDISTKAGECLLLCASTSNEQVATVIVENTDLCYTVISKLAVLYNTVPKSLKQADIDSAVTQWVGDEPEDHPTPMNLPPGQRKILCFLKWLVFVDSLTDQSHPLISNALSSSFYSSFLEPCILPDIVTESNEDLILLTTSLLSNCIRCISSESLMNEIGLFLVGDMKDVETPGFSGHMMKQLLIDRCKISPSSMQIAMTTLQLFEELLHKPTKDIVQSLLLCNLTGRGYYDVFASDSHYSFSDNEEGEGGRSIYEDFDVSPGSSPVSRTFAPNHIHRILNCFLLLLPDEIKSCDLEEDSGYDVYIKDAYKHFQECQSICEKWDWPTQPFAEEEHMIGEDDASSDSQPEADSSGNYFFEGSFLKMIFDTLENMLHQPYDINLQVTSLVSRIAMFPHPNLHEYLLNPLIPLTPGTRSLFQVLLKVVEELQVSIHHISGLKKKLQLTRKALLGEGAEYTSFEDVNLLEALIVIEEFCKELAAIAFVKYHASS